MSENPPLTIGATIWRFDVNHRVYAPKKPGEAYSSGGPIWREHWVPETIEAETSRSWVTRSGRKAPKRGPRFGWAYSEAEVEDACWVNDHRYRIVRAVDRVRDAATLRAIADLIGYRP